MGTLYENVKRNVVDEIPALAPITGNEVTYDSSAQSAEFNASTTQIVVMSTTDCFVSIGSNPTATTTPGINNYSIRAGLLYPFTILERGMKIAAIKRSTAGVLDIIEGR